MSLRQLNNEKELVCSIADGDEKAFALFFNHYYPQLRPFIVKFFEDVDQIEDAIQETFIRVWLNRDQLPEIKNIGAWLHTIVSRICLNAIRDNLTRNKKSDEYAAQPVEQPILPIEKTTISEIKRLVAVVVNDMPEARKRIYLLSREEGLKPAEIAEKLSLSVSTVKNVLVIALKEIRSYLIANGHVVSLLFIMLNYF